MYLLFLLWCIGTLKVGVHMLTPEKGVHQFRFFLLTMCNQILLFSAQDNRDIYVIQTFNIGCAFEVLVQIKIQLFFAKQYRA